MNLQKRPLPEIIALLLISALVYLPSAGNMTYFKDEWYFIYDAYVSGAGVFRDNSALTAPLAAFSLRSIIRSLVLNRFRTISRVFYGARAAAAATIWLLGIVWPRQRQFVFFAALLFLLYPGYFWWVSAIEYQPHMASVALEVISIALTLKAVTASARISKITYMLGAILCGWAYLALVEYAIGMEVFRFLSVYVLVSRSEGLATVRLKLAAALRAWAWNLIIPIGFMVWRVYIFTNERKATDIGVQLSGLFTDPLPTAFTWLMEFSKSLLNMGVLAWVAQFPRFFFGMRVRDMLLALALAGLVLLLVTLAKNLLERDAIPRENLSQDDRVMLSGEALLLGVPGLMVGILPVVMANRFIDLEGFSYYALPASLAAALSMAGFICTISSRRIQLTALYLLIAFASLAHYGIAISAVDEENAIERFWWQVSWRVPALRPDTTLVIKYPSGNIGDDGFGVMEAANMIYFPHPVPQIPLHYNVSAITLNGGNLQDVLAGKLYRHTEYRSHSVDFDYGNLLVLSQPTSTSCVHVIDGRQPLMSVLDPADVRLAAASSYIDNVVVDSDPLIPQDFAFGKEPEHKWCFYFEKAELALQAGNPQAAAWLGEEAIRLGLHPQDPSEWLPFLQAYAVTGNAQRVKQTAPKINIERSLRLQACALLTIIKTPLTPEVHELFSKQYCRNAE